LEELLATRRTGEASDDQWLGLEDSVQAQRAPLTQMPSAFYLSASRGENASLDKLMDSIMGQPESKEVILSHGMTTGGPTPQGSASPAFADYQTIRLTQLNQLSKEGKILPLFPRAHGELRARKSVWATGQESVASQLTPITDKA
jgi:hypothetical protein